MQSFTRTWKQGDVVELDLPMPVRQMAAHPFVDGCTGRVALMRGPVVYCLEGVDHPGVDLRAIAIKRDAKFNIVPDKELLNGVTVVQSRDAIQLDESGEGLYQPAQLAKASGRDMALKAIPYYAWANREKGRMSIWIRQA